MEPSSGREVNGPSTPVSRPADAAASLVAMPVSLNGVQPDGDEPASPVPALHASACAETAPLRKRAADDVKVSPAKVPRAGGPETLAAELHARHMYDAACVLELFEMLPRADVTRHSQSKGSVFAGGSYSHGPIKGLRHFTKDFPMSFDICVLAFCMCCRRINFRVFLFRILWRVSLTPTRIMVLPLTSWFHLPISQVGPYFLASRVSSTSSWERGLLMRVTVPTRCYLLRAGELCL